MLAVLTAVEGWLETQSESKAAPTVQTHMQTAQQIKTQDVELTEAGTAMLRKGMAKERRISIEDAQIVMDARVVACVSMDTKRHVLHDLDSRLIRAVGIMLANAPASIADAQ